MLPLFDCYIEYQNHSVLDLALPELLQNNWEIP